MSYLFTQTPLAFFVQNLWRDEAFSYVMSLQNIQTIIEKSAVDFSPPLYYLVLHFWIKIFGISEIALRSLSLLFFMLTIYIAYDIFTLVFKIPIKRALIYTLLILINPVLLYYAFEARMYMMGAFFVVLSYYALWMKKKNLYVAAITLALYSHYFIILILIGQILAKFVETDRDSWRLIFKKIKQPISTNRNKSQLIFNFLPILLFLPWLIYLPLKHDFGGLDFWVVRPYLSDIRYLLFVLYTGYEKVFGEYYHSGPGYTTTHAIINILLLAVISIPIIFYKFKKIKFPNRQIFADILLWSFGPPITLFLLSFIGKSLYHPRYFMFSAVGFLLLLIFLFELVLTNFSFRKKFSWIKIAIIVMLPVLIYLTFKYSDLNLRYRAKRDVKTMFQEIALSLKPNDVIYLTNELDYHLALYYTKSAKVYIFDKTYDQIPSYVGKSLIPSSALKSDYPDFPSKAYIVGYDDYETYSRM